MVMTHTKGWKKENENSVQRYNNFDTYFLSCNDNLSYSYNVTT